MTMAGSSQGAAIAKWDSYTKMMVGGVEVNLNSNLAACQDIGALPAGLDGILYFVSFHFAVVSIYSFGFLARWILDVPLYVE